MFRMYQLVPGYSDRVKLYVLNLVQKSAVNNTAVGNDF